MKSFNSPFLDVVLRVPTWSRSSVWKHIYKSSFIHVLHEGPIQISLPLCLFLHSPSEWIISFLMLSWIITIVKHLLGVPYLTTASEHACGIHQRLRSPWFTPKVFLSVFLCTPSALCVENTKFNETASSLGFPDRHVGRALGLDLKCTATLLTAT